MGDIALITNEFFMDPFDNIGARKWLYNIYARNSIISC